MFVEVDAGTGQLHVTFDLKITVRPRMASSISHVAGELETSSAELSDQHSSDQQPDDPEKGPYIIGLFGKPIPVSQTQDQTAKIRPSRDRATSLWTREDRG